MKKCNHCNQLLEDDAKFCPVCGNKIEETNPENEESNNLRRILTGSLFGIGVSILTTKLISILFDI